MKKYGNGGAIMKAKKMKISAQWRKYEMAAAMAALSGIESHRRNGVSMAALSNV